MCRAWAGALCVAAALSAQACAPATAPPVTIAAPAHQPAVAQDVVFQTSVEPQPDEDLGAPCRYELTLTDPSRPARGVWVIFERSRETLLYYQDADVRSFARRHDLALLYPFHCRSKSPETEGDMNVDPGKGIGRALFAALSQLAQTSGHSELTSTNLLLLGFSGTSSLVGRLAGYAPERVIAVIATGPGHFDPLGMDTIHLSPIAAAIPQLILAGSADAVSGTERPYAYFRRHFEQGAPWTFIVQNQAPHCCIMNAKPLLLEWLDTVVTQNATRTPASPKETLSARRGWYGFIETTPTEASDCPQQVSPPPRPTWCRSPKDIWGGANWSVTKATIARRPNPPRGMMPAGWLPSEAFAKQWTAFVTQPEHPVTMPP